MNLTYVLGVVAALGTLFFVIELLRRGILRERFAVLWLLIAAGLLAIAVIPSLLTWGAALIGIEVPSNLLFVAGGLVLLIVSVQLSWEASVADARVRRLAEEIALLRLEIERLQRQEPDDS